MTDFWFNHFNVYLNKDGRPVPGHGPMICDVIRAHAFWQGFKDLLVATAQSPAMLFYLDNWLSEGPKSPAAASRQQGQAWPGSRRTE